MLPHQLDFSWLPSVSLSQREQLPTASGIYFLLMHTKTGWVIAYVGRASNFLARWTGDRHHVLKKIQPGTESAFRISWLSLDIPFYQLDRTEKEYIRYFQPLWNQVHNRPEKEPRKVKKARQGKPKAKPKLTSSKGPKTPMESFREYARQHLNKAYPG